jgi:hypothetical protein
MTFQWRRLTVEYRRKPRAHALPDAYDSRSAALCGRTPARGAEWIAGDGLLRCKRCERQTHVRRLVVDL